MSDAAVVCSNLSFAWPDDTPVFDALSFSLASGRTGLVAPNGAGKSTLLKLLAGELKPTSGSLAVAGTLGHLPQTLPLTGDVTVAEVLGVAAVIRALDAVESGDVSEEHFTAIGDDWDIEERTRAQLDRLGLAGLALDRRLSPLSGGRMERIAELDGGELRFHGGNFSAYEEAVRSEQEVAERNVRSAEQELKREKREMQQARERAERRAGNAARNLKSPGLPRIFAGTMKRGTQESAGRAVSCTRPGSARPGPVSTRRDAPCARSSDSPWSCPTPRCPPAAPSSWARGCRYDSGTDRCSPRTVSISPSGVPSASP